MNPDYRYLKQSLSSLEITHALVDVLNTPVLNDHAHVVLLALRFAQPNLQSADLTEVQQFLHSIDTEHIVSLVKAIKQQLRGISCLKLQHQHDIMYVAYQKDEQNALEVCLQQPSGESMQLNFALPPQTPAIESSIQAPEDHLMAGAEILASLKHPPHAEQQVMLQSVEDAVDLWLTIKDPNDEHFWDYFPAISIVSVSLVIYALFKRYQKQEITWQEFCWRAAKISGIKVTKIAMIGVLLGLPVIGQVTGAYLVAELLLNAKATWFEKDAPLYRYLLKKEQNLP